MIFAYTIKAWGLPTQGHPANHSALLTNEQWAQLAETLGADVDDPWASFAEGTPEKRSCAAARPSGSSGRRCPQASRRCRAVATSAAATPAAPRPSRRSGASSSTSRATRPRSPRASSRCRPTSPRRPTWAAGSTASGVWNLGERIDWFADDTDTLVRWRESAHGQHIELGIAEVNLVGLLGELGATWSRDGQPLLPIGTLYDPFVNRALEPWSFGIYAGGQSILVGTPSGVTLAPEGGAHQSIITPSIGLEQPGCVAWEPAFGQDLEWTLLARARRSRPAARQLGVLPTEHPARSTRRWPRCPPTRRRASTGAGRCSPAATGCAEAARARESRSSGWARSCPRCSPRPTS